MDDWPFEDPPNVAAITLKTILRREQPILRVIHDDDEGYWHFLTLENLAADDGAVVSLFYITQLEPAVLELADLPLGWHAWRPAQGHAWQRVKL